MTRSRVFIVRPRSDQNREIESRDDNVSVMILAQSRKETEFFELNAGYSRVMFAARAWSRNRRVRASKRDLSTSFKRDSRVVVIPSEARSDAERARHSTPCAQLNLQVSARRTADRWRRSG
jgi:hypothetical protein